ncbi:MAG: hypothetical protein LBK73_10935 [Treponema sp.]|nr:hypothetical protein [Treponema sp.]
MAIYELGIRKEVLNFLVDGIYANCLNEAILREHQSLGKMAMKIFYLRKDIRDAETMEELEIVNEKLMEYHKKLCKIESGEMPVD